MACHASRLASILRCRSLALYPVFLLSPPASSAFRTEPRAVPVRVRTNSPALPLRGGGVCRDAGTHPLTTERARGRDPFHGDASVEAVHGACLVAENETARSAPDQAVWRDACARAVLADSF